jgi:hypothetical protein
MKTHIALFAIALALSGCTNGQGEVDVTTSNVATFPAISTVSAGQQLAGETLTTNAEIRLDVHKDLQSLSSLGALTGAISKDAVSGSDLSFVRHIKVTIATLDRKMPIQVLSDVEVPQNAAEIDLPRLIDDELVLEYLREGKVAIGLSVTGSLPERSLTLTHTLVAHMNVAMQGSITKL